MYRKQFLFTKKKGDFPNLEEIQTIEEYTLYIGKDSEYCFVKNEIREFHLLGSIYDWENPQFLNEQILENISQEQRLEDILRATDNYCGQFVLIVKLYNEIFIFNDAASQKEIYYDNNFTCFGTQPKLLGLSVDLLEHNSEDAKEYYSSQNFKKKCLFVWNTTHKSNIFHLMPNHILNVKKKSTNRFFPAEILKKNTLDYVSKKSSQMLKGYINAISKRNKLKMAVTGGYDSRVLFLASLNVECEYFVTRHPNMNDSHHDIFIPKRLTSYYDKDFMIGDDNLMMENIEDTDYINDIDFPRFWLSRNKSNNDLMYINGNVSEIARNYFGYYKNATAKDLCFLSGNSTLSFATKQYSIWLKNKSVFKKYGYHYLDMFYWEEKMGNWQAKSKTEAHALDRNVLSPFNSRKLLNLLLSTKRKDRDSHFNRLYDLMIYELSGNDNEIIKIPINPSRKRTIFGLMKYFKIYNLYRFIKVKLRK
ncbi:hypothetical protein [Maribacter polysaccharolyticus]|uniref:hypothetical protein n=1 Tax=Maribacter polysaccharolyticus TaxID=3020831 RepID=UPI00237F8869|nr:hypothetical protein [Maribacter polysaccharolyticus]MDE3743503.1 hypothetical protein [Maribacter polysaccharolyticus]